MPNYESVARAAACCASEKAFKRKYPEEYRTARRNGWLLQVCKTMTHGGRGVQIVYTAELLLAEAKKYKTPAEFEAGSYPYYHAAYRRGLLAEVCAHMEHYKVRDVNYLLSLATNFTDRGSFSKAHSKAYNSAKRLGVLDQICAHMVREKSPVRDRLISKTKIGSPDECWTWQGPINSSGYGYMWIKGTNRLAHRHFYQVVAGKEIPEGLILRHTCDNPKCVNPEHLIPGTHQENMQDMIDRGRAYYQRIA